MKRRAKLALALPALALIVLGVAASGLIPIAASAGHWAVTEWLLSFTMARSVATHAMGIEPPALDEERLVLLGAGHYETGCRPCHGAPGERMPVIPRAMTPHPPDLVESAPEWSAAELFYIVRHGVKMTGMPAWPALEREDEVWAVVAFLKRLPELDAEGYRELVFGDTERAVERLELPGELSRDALALCARCHGVDGRGRGAGAFPELAGQRAEYLEAALRAYADGERASGVMQPVAASLREETLRALVEHYAAQPPFQAKAVAEPELVARGRALALEGLPAEDLPSCADCHGPSETAPRPHYPRLAGQHAAYLEQQLALFARGARGGSPFAPIMREVAHELEPEQIEAAAAFYASLELDSGGD